MNEPTVYTALLNAARSAFQALFQEHNETFYYCTLILSEGATPFVSAFSEEALAAEVQKYEGRYSAEDLRWSYADSPYCGYGYETYFQTVDKLFNEQMSVVTSDEDYEAAIESWLSLMEQVMRTLDQEKLFGEGEARSRMLINAEIMPPEDDNAERGKRLNSGAIYELWYEANFA